MNTVDPPLNAEELAVIQALKRLAKKWPKSLMLFSGSGTLYVLRNRPDGSFPMTSDGPDGCADRTASIWSTRKINNDGGDW